MKIEIKSQGEFDALPEEFDQYTIIEIRTEEVIKISKSCGNATVNACGNATVDAWDTAAVYALDNAKVIAWDNATVHARDTATVYAWGNATVDARGHATVISWDTATVHARDTAIVYARGNATVYALDNAKVIAWENATVHARDTATVYARVNANVDARDNATVTRLSCEEREVRGKRRKMKNLLFLFWILFVILGCSSSSDMDECIELRNSSELRLERRIDMYAKSAMVPYDIIKGSGTWECWNGDIDLQMTLDFDLIYYWGRKHKTAILRVYDNGLDIYEFETREENTNA